MQGPADPNAAVRQAALAVIGVQRVLSLDTLSQVLAPLMRAGDAWMAQALIHRFHSRTPFTLVLGDPAPGSFQVWPHESFLWRYDAAGRAVLGFPSGDRSTLDAEQIARWLLMFAVFEAITDRGGFRGAAFINLGDGPRDGALNFCSHSDFESLIPDFSFLATRAYGEMRAWFARADAPRWEDRSDTVFWRGGTTGQHDGDVLNLPRVRLARLVQDAPDAEAFDIGIHAYGQVSPDEEARLRGMGLTRPYVPPHHLDRYKLLVDIDGNSNAWSGLMQKLLSGGAVMKVASAQGFRQWYYDQLIPWTHYAPVRADLGDFLEVARRLRADPAQAHAIGQAGRALALSLTYDGAVDFTLERLSWMGARNG